MRARSISALGVAAVAAIGGFIGGCEILTGSLDEQRLDGGSEAPVDASVVRVDASVSSDAGSGPEAQASSALAYCDEAWELLMRRLPACYGGDRGYFERLADAYGVSCEAGADAVRTGRYSFTESKARDCLERMSMVSCPELTRSGVFAAIWCSDLLVGAVDEGDGCSDSDCRPGLACDLALLHGTDSVEPIPGTCTIRCVDAGGRQGLGAPCPRGSVDCGPGLLCRAPTEDPAAAPRCLALPRAGERCRSTCRVLRARTAARPVSASRSTRTVRRVPRSSPSETSASPDRAASAAMEVMCVCRIGASVRPAAGTCHLRADASRGATKEPAQPSASLVRRAGLHIRACDRIATRRPAGARRRRRTEHPAEILSC